MTAYRGRQAYTLFLQVYQLILWKQCHALVQGRGFPAELEVSETTYAMLHPAIMLDNSL